MREGDKIALSFNKREIPFLPKNIRLVRRFSKGYILLTYSIRSLHLRVGHSFDICTKLREINFSPFYFIFFFWFVSHLSKTLSFSILIYVCTGPYGIVIINEKKKLTTNFVELICQNEELRIRIEKKNNR